MSDLVPRRHAEDGCEHEGKAQQDARLLSLYSCVDTLVDNLTVQEMLLYTAEMKLEMDVSMAKKRERVEELLQQLALEGCRNVRIGSNMQRGISGKTIFMSAADIMNDTCWSLHGQALVDPQDPASGFLQKPGK